jgi:uncharacterized protein (TIGR02594 family)
MTDKQMIGTKALENKYLDLASADVPRTIREAVALYGIVEDVGDANDPQIMAWAKENAKTVKGYNADSIPWCGLFAATVVNRAGFGDQIPENPLWALNWLKFGRAIDNPALGDVLVFRRLGGGHVGFYVGESADKYFVLGGNQGDKVSIITLPKAFKKEGVGFRGARRPIWKVAQPRSVMRIERSSRGVVTGGTLT